MGGIKGQRVWRALGTGYGFVCPYGLANGLLLTGDQKYVDCWRTNLDVVASHSKTVDGKVLYPSCYSDDERMGQTEPVERPTTSSSCDSVPFFAALGGSESHRTSRVSPGLVQLQRDAALHRGAGSVVLVERPG